MNEVVIAIPVYKQDMDGDDLISIRQYRKYLKNYPVVLVAPDALNVSAYEKEIKGLTVERFPNKYFKGIRGYNRLMLSADFYRRFVNYKYILIYQLDAIVLSDQLKYWCTQGYDYIGPPWLETSHGGELRFLGVGNGGLSLRKVAVFLEVLERGEFHSDSLSFDRLNHYAGEGMIALLKVIRGLHRLPKWARELAPLFFKSQFFLRLLYKNEDIFWGYYAPFFVAQFNLPTPDIALKFAFECRPEDCYSANNGQLPFGVHAWKKYGRNFWSKIIE